MKKLKKLVVLDHSVGEVYVYPYDESKFDCPEDFANEDGYVLNGNCEWMLVDELNIAYK
jgi:hypothetical protein